MTCPLCNDKGSVGYEHPEVAREYEGGTITSGGYSTELCQCRRDLPRRFGKASWWWCESVAGETMETGGGLGTVSVHFSREIPISEDNYPLHRTADNCYFSVTPRVEVDCGPAMTADDLRQIAAMFMRMADKCDELDKPSANPTPEPAK